MSFNIDDRVTAGSGPNEVTGTVVSTLVNGQNVARVDVGGPVHYSVQLDDVETGVVNTFLETDLVAAAD